jgi:hypothetical protein
MWNGKEAKPEQGGSDILAMEMFSKLQNSKL